MKTRLYGVLLALVSAFGFAGAALPQTFVSAQPGYHYEFPRDHFNHPDYQTEWWYYTGHLRAADGHRFGFELTFFREGATRKASTSPWSLNDIYMAHLALSDLSGHHYYTTERLNRAGPGIAGADAPSGNVWNGNWQTVITPKAHQLRGVGEDFSFDLRAAPRKNPVIHGVNGVSQKSVDQASHYISLTRMAAMGTVILHNEAFKVEGDAWMDHEFFTNADGGVGVGWDWLSIQLEDDTELMLYRLRHKDGSVDPFSSGSYIDATGTVMHLNLSDFAMLPTGMPWKSKSTGASYPLAWTVTIPKLHLQLAARTQLNNQEFVSRFGPSYWEGAIDVSGSRGTTTMRGAGYLEMTGYARETKPLISR